MDHKKIYSLGCRRTGLAMKSKEYKGIWIPDKTLQDKNLTLHQKIIYAMIENLAGERPCTASNSYFAERLGLSEHTVSRHIGNLKAVGRVTVRLRRDKTTKEVRFREIRPTSNYYKLEGGVANIGEKVSEGEPLRNIGEGIIIKDIYKKEDNKAENVSNSNKLGKDRENSFEVFWKTIPSIRRINKQRTKKNWIKATQKVSPETIQDAMVLTVERVEARYIKTSYAWLSEKRWESVPEEQEKIRKAFQYR